MYNEQCRSLPLFLLSLCAFPSLSQAKIIWSNAPALGPDIIQKIFPIGNGRLAAMPNGAPGAETLTLNLDSLWSGGPFESSSYTGGNPTNPVYQALDHMRSSIFTRGTGNVTELLGSDSTYGSYRVLGNVTFTIPSLLNSSTTITNYTRSLNLANGIHTTRYRANDNDFETTAFCSYPHQVCVYTVAASKQLPTVQVSLRNDLVSTELQSELQNITCGPAIRMRGITQVGPPEGIRYDAIVRFNSGISAGQSYNNKTCIMSIHPSNTKTITFVIGAGTNYDAKKGTAKDGYSFRGEDPGPALEKIVRNAAESTYAKLRGDHTEDFDGLMYHFDFSLPDPLNSAKVPTADLIAQYKTSSAAGDPYLETLLFEYAKYLFVSSSRPGSLPPNLQGKWSEGLYAAWSGDYHANINLQMNHWLVDQTKLGEIQTPLWDYMTDTWVPRGRETAKLLYNAPGWVVHDEMNIFGHTGMKSGAEWANYPAAAAWMMQHVSDHWDYSRNVTWLRAQGYPLLKGVAEFWLSQLQLDTFTNDGSLVVNPCNSPEHGPTTFGCAHYQQLIHAVFDFVLSLQPTIADTDTAFISNVTSSHARLDKGFRTGSFSQIKEWKLPDSFNLDTQNDTHRHLSELVGWHPGSSLSSFLGGYTNATIQSAVHEKLYSRGFGTGPDANAGWAKVWRAAAWARLNDTERAHFELRYAMEQNLAPNGLSMYSGRSGLFQIDANFGFGGAVLSMLVVDLPRSYTDKSVQTVVLGPAIPAAWAGGKVRGLRLRGGGSVDFEWDEKGVVNKAKLWSSRTEKVRIVNRDGALLAEV